MTMVTALASLYTKNPARSDTAMTGEITLTGLVLPIGGVKEKVLAARRAGIKRVILPKANQKDLRDLPEDVRNGDGVHLRRACRAGSRTDDPRPAAQSVGSGELSGESIQREAPVSGMDAGAFYACMFLLLG